MIYETFKQYLDRVIRVRPFVASPSESRVPCCFSKCAHGCTSHDRGASSHVPSFLHTGVPGQYVVRIIPLGANVLGTVGQQRQHATAPREGE